MIFRIKRKQTAGKSDEELAGLFRSTGDTEILGELYSGYMHLVYGLCMKYLKNREESMDAVMQIYEKVSAEMPKHEIANFKSWLYVVAKNYCLMQLRSEKTREEKIAEWLDDQVIFMESDSFLHPVDEEVPDPVSGLTECIEKLKSEQKECIKQFYYDNRCYNEIAANLKIDEKKVKSSLQNAKRNLKICMEEKDGRKR